MSQLTRDLTDVEERILCLHEFTQAQRDLFMEHRMLIGTHAPTADAVKRVELMDFEEVENTLEVLGTEVATDVQMQLVFTLYKTGEAEAVMRRLAALVLSRSDA
jgi:hypothetical protein